MIKSLIAFLFDFHIWVDISKDSENQEAEEPETYREKYPNAVSGRKISNILLQKKMSHLK